MFPIYYREYYNKLLNELPTNYNSTNSKWPKRVELDERNNKELFIYKDNAVDFLIKRVARLNVPYKTHVMNCYRTIQTDIQSGQLALEEMEEE
jgi:hypothetical protein